jgi:colanic acid biosynthesis glycosyl transferase WcaI
MAGLLQGAAMEHELAATSLGVVTQRPDVAEFNLPSKLMNYMAHGLPVLAIVRPDSETARLVSEAGAGVVVDAARLEQVPDALERLLGDPADLERMGQAAHRYAEERFSPDRVAERWEAVLESAVRRRR